MFEFLIGLGVTYLLTWPTLIGIALLAVIVEHNEGTGFAVFLTLVAGAISYFFFHLTWQETLMYLAGYIVAGCLWSFWRYKRYVEKRVEKSIEDNDNVSERKRLAERLRPTNMLSSITAWIVVWPFSFVEHMTSDIIDAIQRLVKTVFRGIYNRIYLAAIKPLKVDLDATN